MPTPFAVEACSTTYGDVHKMVCDVCQKFAKLHGGDVEEYISVANMVFTTVYWSDGWDSTKSTFSSWIWRKVWYALLEDMRTSMGRNNRLPRVDLDLALQPAEQPEFDVEEHLAFLSEDARVVVEMVLGDSIPLALEVFTHGGEFTPGNVKRGLAAVLKDLGWASTRIFKAFQEIQEIV